MEERDIFDKILSVTERSIEAIGRTKGHIELLERRIDEGTRASMSDRSDLKDHIKDIAERIGGSSANIVELKMQVDTLLEFDKKRDIRDEWIKKLVYAVITFQFPLLAAQ